MRDSDYMRVNIGCLDHGRNNIFDSRGTQKAKVHLKLILEIIGNSGVVNRPKY
jgi:hypothetical protein